MRKATGMPRHRQWLKSRDSSRERAPRQGKETLSASKTDTWIPLKDSDQICAGRCCHVGYLSQSSPSGNTVYPGETLLWLVI